MGRLAVRATYRSCASTATAPSLWTTRIPEFTRPKIVCLLSRYGVGASVRKNCDPVMKSDWDKVEGYEYYI